MHTLKQILAPTVLLAFALLIPGIIELVLADDPAWLVLGAVLFALGQLIEPPKGQTGKTRIELQDFRVQDIESGG